MTPEPMLDHVVELEVRSLFPARPFDRRSFLAAGVGVGFAACVAPSDAQTVEAMIRTNTDGLVAGVVQVGADKVPAYRARPAHGGTAPVVLVVSEIFGVHEHIADVCRRLAKRGYYAIAAEFFERQGDVKTPTAIQDVIAVVARVPDVQVMGDLDACVAFAASEGANTTRLAITGFCWGGRITWLYASHNPALKAAVAWYGRLTNSFNPVIQPKNPIELVAQLRAPVLGLYGGQDGGIPLTDIEKMKVVLSGGSAAAQTSEFVVFRDAQHAFNADYRPSYNKDAAEEGWKRMLAWFEAHGA
jgi:carboxymethylenebutenolidase